MHDRDIRLEAVGRIIAGQPKSAAERTLELLVGVLDASTGALFDVEGERYRLFVGRSMDQRALDRVRDLWAREDERRALCSGTVFVGGEPFAVVPIAHQGAVVALLYLSADRRLAANFASMAEAVAPLLASAVMAAEATAEDSIDAYLRRTPMSDMEREKLVLLLNQQEWNISRVARELGCTRVTVYQRMKKHGIQRQRVPKTPPRKPLPQPS